MTNVEEISNLGGLVISFLVPLYVARSSTIKSVNFSTLLDTLISAVLDQFRWLFLLWGGSNKHKERYTLC